MTVPIVVSIAPLRDNGTVKSKTISAPIESVRTAPSAGGINSCISVAPVAEESDLRRPSSASVRRMIAAMPSTVTSMYRPRCPLWTTVNSRAMP